MLDHHSDKHIVAMGGGGFSMELDNPLLDQYVLRLVNKAQPKVCFLPTASGDSDRYIVKFYSAFLKFRCQPCHLSLFNPPTLDLRNFLLEQDIIYVGGGNTKNLVALWRDWEFSLRFERGMGARNYSVWTECGLTVLV